RWHRGSRQRFVLKSRGRMGCHFFCHLFKIKRQEKECCQMCCVMGYAGHDLTREEFTAYLLRTASRGPDDHRVLETEFGFLGFGRLAIMGVTPEGMQPFEREGSLVACNGELYGFRPVRAELEGEGYTFRSDSDCEI